MLEDTMLETPQVDVINFVSGINQKSIANLIEITGQARNGGSSKIILNISSTGGDLHSAFAAYYHLRSLGIPLVSHNTGNIESSAVLLYLAADVRFAAPHARFLFHSFHWSFGSETVHHPLLREKTACLDFDTQRYRDILNERTQSAERQIEIFKSLDDNSFCITSAAAAVTGGICSQIAEPAVPAGAVLWWLNTSFVS
jgi:ATP-dependent Clp protease protease subunit